jgi:UDP-N-acetylmuramyl pentapeptide phosphotransferase/UDP-N-acetylglucosamine-1-phosphate transferase
MSFEAILKYPAIFLAGLLAAFLLTPVWRRLAPGWGFMDRPGDRKVHRQPVPRGGGLAVFIGFHAACAVVFLFPWKPFAGQLSIDWWFRFLPLSAGVVALGLLDDRFDLKPLVKLLVQIALGAAAYALGFRLQNLFGFALPGWVDVLATVFWFVALMNAFNLIDGVDGLATGIALIAAGGIGLSLVFRGAPGDVLLFLGLAGACLGFLRYNFYPASVFLGDAGSLFLGFTLAALSISTNSKASFMAGLGVPMLAVGVPLFDVVLAVWRRSMRRILNHAAGGEGGAGIETADADHLHHRLLRRGFGQGQVAGFLYAATLLLVVVGLLASAFRDRALGILVLAFLLAAYTVVRHLAGIELHESGQVVLQGLARPVRRNRTLLFYLVGDLLILNLVLLAGHALLDLQDGVLDMPLKAAWLKSAPVDLFIPFAVLLLFRSYSRVWYLARVSEYASTGLAVALGYAIAGGLHLLVARSPGEAWSLALYYLLLAGLAAPAVVLSRAALRVVQDLMQWRTRGPGTDAVAPARALVCGAGYRTTLFLRQISFRAPARAPVEVVGLVSEDAAITGHAVHGIRVVGTCHELPALIARHRADVVYLVEAVAAADFEELRRALNGLPVRLVRWDIVETDVPLHG